MGRENPRTLHHDDLLAAQKIIGVFSQYFPNQDGPIVTLDFFTRVIRTLDPTFTDEDLRIVLRGSGHHLTSNLVDSQALIRSLFHAPAIEPDIRDACAVQTVHVFPEAARSSVRPRWARGSTVERLLDDMSNIWVGAIVLCANGGELYDVEYEADGSIEYGVEGCELRARSFRLDLPTEIWCRVGCYFYEKQDLCSLEVLARASCLASQQEAQGWWCTAYHQRFGRCGPRCAFKRVNGAAGAMAATKAVASCVVTAALGLTPIERQPWKSRFVQQERCSSSWYDDTRGPTQDSGAYGLSGHRISYGHMDGRLLYGQNALGGMYFDPRLGRMIREY